MSNFLGEKFYEAECTFEEVSEKYPDMDPNEALNQHLTRIIPALLIQTEEGTGRVGYLSPHKILFSR